MLTKEYKVSDEMDNKVMEKLHNTQFYRNLIYLVF